MVLICIMLFKMLNEIRDVVPLSIVGVISFNLSFNPDGYSISINNIFYPALSSNYTLYVNRYAGNDETILN